MTLEVNMTERIFRADTVQIDHRNYVEDKDPIFGAITVFKDVDIASEIIHSYEDGKAYKPADELKASYWTWENRWAISGDHPSTGIVSKRGDVHGRTVNLRYVKNLKDHKTSRTNRRGILSDLQVFNNKVSPEILADMKSGKKSDVSIGFFFTMDEVAGKVEEDGHPLNGQEYDFIQRDFMGDHTAFGIDKGRCAMPYCGIGADKMMSQFALDPFGKWKNMAACIKDIMKENPDYTKKQAAATCASIEKKSKTKKDAFVAFVENMRGKADEVLTQLSEIEELNSDGEKTIIEDTMSDEELAGIFEFYSFTQGNWDDLPDEIRVLLTTRYDESKEAPEDDAEPVDITDDTEVEDDCPECDEKAEQLATDLSLEDIDVKLKELKTSRERLREQVRELDEKLYAEPASEKKRKKKIRTEREELWDRLDGLYDEIRAYTEAKSIKITQAALADDTNKGKPPVEDEPPIIDTDELLARSRDAIRKMTHPF